MFCNTFCKTRAIPDLLAEFKAGALATGWGWREEDGVRKGERREVERRKKGRKGKEEGGLAPRGDRRPCIIL